MDILKEKTRLLVTNYTDGERRHLEDMVASMDNVYMYADPDSGVLGLEPGITQTIRRIFPYAKYKDNSFEYWDFNKIQPVEHDAQPRNQLQKDFIAFVLANAKKMQKLAGVLSPGCGKQLINSTLIPTIHGPVPIGEIQIGDTIFGSNGRPTKVIGVYPQGEKDLYKITFSDGRTSIAGEEHLWSVTTALDPTPKVLTTRQIMETYKQYYYRIQLMSGPAQYPHRDVKVDPYVMGAFIGNGCMTQKPLQLSSGNDFVPMKCASILHCEARKNKSNYTYDFYLPGTHSRIQTADVFGEYPEACGYSRDRVIPDDYIYNDIDTRIELLRGLMDTDGSITFSNGRYNVRYSSSSRKLLEQIRQIILSLGFISNIGSPDNRSQKYVGGYHAVLEVRVPHAFKQQLFTLPFKRDLAIKASNMSDSRQSFKYLSIKDIEYYGRDQATCIAVDAEDSLFATENFIITHNTFMACYSAIALCQKTLFIVPTSGIKEQWVDTLVKMFKVPPERVLNVRGPRDFIDGINFDFVVASHASLASLNKKYDLEALMKRHKFGIKVIDEVQMWFKNIISIDANCNIPNNWYLTGTFGRSGETENRIYQEMFGDLAIFREQDKQPTIFNRRPGNVYGMKPHMHTTMIWTKSGLSPEEIRRVTSSMRYSEREGKWVRFGISVPAYMELVIPSDGSMTRYLKTCLRTVQIAEDKIKYGSTLVLGATIASAEIIASYLRKMFPMKKVGTYHSHHSKEENDRAKKESDILVSTTQSAGTGFDVKGLAKLIVVTPFKSWILADQISGRLRRRDDGKDTFFWEVVDSQIPQLRAWANNRADVYRRKSKSFKVVDM